jgi:beta-galactosidase/beta-glucuronidase
MKKILLGTLAAIVLAIVSFSCFVLYTVYQLSRPVEVQSMTTPWTAAATIDLPLPEYPRPQLRRARWQNLNGSWDYAITAGDDAQPSTFAQSIRVPFALESKLSGVERRLQPSERLWYRRFFTVIAPAGDERLLLHFGAVDWEAEVWLNQKLLGVHRGGFTPFSFDITDALHQVGEQELVVAVRDPTSSGPGAYGKQDLEPGGIRYSPVGGIWQTVWLEPAPPTRITRALVVATDLSAGEVTIRVQVNTDACHCEVAIIASASGADTATARAAIHGNTVDLRLKPEQLRPWSPDDPFLYDLDVALWEQGQARDRVQAYFGAREISVEKDAGGFSRLFLNGQPLFHLGLLDQGWWPDGLYTAPTDEALMFDIKATRQMGFNTIRKHVKREPARWYWHADRLGVLVWQDMPTGGGSRGSRFNEYLGYAVGYIFNRKPEDGDFELTRSPQSSRYYRQELADMVDGLEPHPSIVAWVPFNEAWGQFSTDEIIGDLKKRDPTRLIDGPSGWVDTGSGDMLDLHVYAREEEFVESLPPERALVYGEYGGVGFVLEEHQASDSSWGYSTAKDTSAFHNAYKTLAEVVASLKPRGLAGAIYTQTTDVESEINGLISYDRRQFKLPPEDIERINRQLIEQASSSNHDTH